MRDDLVQSPTIRSRLQEFEEGEDTKLKDSGPTAQLSTEELRRGRRPRRINQASTNVQQEVEKGSLQEPGIRELAELPRSPLPSYNVRELAGPPKSSLPDASIQELVEHQQNKVEPNNFRSEANNLQEEVVEIYQQECMETSPTVRHRNGLSSGFYYPPSATVQGNYVRDFVLRDSVRNTTEHLGQPDYPDAHLCRIRTNPYDASGHQSHEHSGPNIYIRDQQGNLYEAQLHNHPNINEDAMETSKAFHPRYGEICDNGKPMTQFCQSIVPGRPVSTRTPEDRTIEPFQSVGSVYHTARTKHEHSRYMEDPSTGVEVRTRERKILFGTDDSEDEDVSKAQCRRTRKTEADAKVSKTQHSYGRSTSSSRNLRRRTSSSSRRSSGSTSGSTSTEDRRRDHRRSSTKKISGSGCRCKSEQDSTFVWKVNQFVKKPETSNIF